MLSQAINEIEKFSGGHARICAHGAEAGDVATNPRPQEPSSHEVIARILQNYGIRNEDLIKKFGSFEREQIVVDQKMVIW